MKKLRRLVPVVAVALAVSLALLALGGCASSQTSTTSTTGSETGTRTGEPVNKPIPIRIGVLPNEDSLPLFVAEQAGLFQKAGLSVTLTLFPSAAERDAALQAGSIDAASADIIAAALLTSHGFPVKIVTLELGATPEQGRFGILAAKNSGINSLNDLAKSGGALAQSSGTLPAYAADRLILQAGVDPRAVKREEVKKLPVRYQLLSQGKVPAAVLPEPFFSLGVKDGLKVLADDSKGPAEHLSDHPHGLRRVPCQARRQGERRDAARHLGPGRGRDRRQAGRVPCPARGQGPSSRPHREQL